MALSRRRVDFSKLVEGGVVGNELRELRVLLAADARERGTLREHVQEQLEQMFVRLVLLLSRCCKAAACVFFDNV
jgi:hypothetical protein